MSSPKQGDAAFRYVDGGQEYWHHLGHPLHQVHAQHPEQVFAHTSADLSTVRRVRIASTVEDLRAIIRWDGANDSLARFLKAARAGATLEYFPSVANGSESYPCILMSASQIQPDSEFWWQYRYGTQVHLRRIDGGSWAGLTDGLLFYYKAGHDMPGLTFTRTGSVGPYVDAAGVMQSADANEFRTTWVDGTPYLLLEDARTNLVSTDDLTAWTAVRSPTVTGSVSDPAGGTGAYTIDDSGAGNWEYIYHGVTFTGDSTTTAVFVVRENTMPASGNHSLRVDDSTAGTSRLNLVISAWSNGEPTVTAAAGTYLGKREIGNGYWAIYGEATGVVVGNSNRIVIAPASSNSVSGSIDVYRANAYNDNVPGFSILDASEARSADTWYADFPHAPQEMTVYVKMLPVGSHLLQTTNQGRILQIGDGGTGVTARLDTYFTNPTTINFRYGDGLGASRNANITISQISTGDTLEIRCVLNADGSISGGLSINANTEQMASTSAALPLVSTWGNTRLYLNSAGASRGLGLFNSVKVARGIKTMAQMRAL